jgi:ligand-binding SRPBCC domain-containing protein
MTQYLSTPKIDRQGSRYTLTMTQRLALPPEDLFPFFADAHNLERITPDTVKFEVLTPKPIEMQQGTPIDYKLRIKGIPQRWRTEITAWEPNRRFVDEQLKGPYRLWRHEHRFESDGQGGTVCDDRVDFEIGMGPLGHLAAKLFVVNDVRKIFTHRAVVLDELFNPEREIKPNEYPDELRESGAEPRHGLPSHA